MPDDLIERLRDGCVLHPKRWSGDTHYDLGGSINEAATDALMREAADALSRAEAVSSVHPSDRPRAITRAREWAALYAAERERADRAEADARRLDSGTLCICERSTFGTMFKMTYTGIDLRAAIDAAMGGEVGE